MNKKFIGPKLRLARTFNGFTLAELGELVSTSRQYIQKLEVDPKTSPSEDLLFALAEILGVVPSFFYIPLTDEVREEHGFFRKMRTTPVNVKNRILSLGTVFNTIVSYLDSKLSLPKVDIPHFTTINVEDIEEAAEKTRMHWGLTIDAPIHSMTRTLENAGIVITSFEGISEKVDAFSLAVSRPIIVKSLDKESTSRARFDLAHECGHFVMHTGIETGDHSIEAADVEAQANRFASAFLLPREAFKYEFPYSNHLDWNALYKFKDRWGASVQAIIRRAFDLNIISAIQYRNANIFISRSGTRKKELNEPPEEIPEIIPMAFQLLKEHYGITVDDVAKNLHLGIKIFEDLGLIEKTKEQGCEIISLDEFRQFKEKK